MNELDFVNMYFNLVFKYNVPSHNRVYEDYQTIIDFKQWLIKQNISFSFINQIDEDNIKLFLRARSFQQVDYVLKTNYEQELINYQQIEKDKYQVVLLPGVDDNSLFNQTIKDKYVNDNIRIFSIDNGISSKDISIYGPFRLFLHALYQIDKWPGILVFKGNEKSFIPVNNNEDISKVFELINDGTIFDHQYINNDNYFIHLSDLHLGAKKSDEGLTVLNESLDKIYSTLKPTKQLRFIITGDLMNSPNRKNMYQASTFMNRLRKAYHGDVTFVLGNHDVIVHGFNFLKRQKAKVVAYLLGENIKVLEDEKIILIKIDSTSEGNLARGKVGSIKLHEIDEELEAIDNLKDYTLVAMLHHHVLPIVKDNFLKTKWSEKIFVGKLMDRSKALVDSKELIAWLQEKQIHYVLHGHKHIPYYEKYQDLNVIACGSSCGGGAKENKSKYLSYNILKYDCQNKKFKYCFIFYDDTTKQERQRVIINIL